MRRIAPLAALALALLAGSARADTYAIVPNAAPLAIPSVAPNAAGAIAVPPALSLPPAAPERLGYAQLLGLWQRAGAAYDVPWQVLAAINKVESNFGRNMGPSSAGAIGWMQFMPATWLEWGVDANGDGVADPWNPTDAVYSAARYLAASGASTDLYRAVFAYNHADWYVREVLGLADVYGAGSTVAFSLDRLQQRLDDARRAVADAGDALLAAQQALRVDRRLAVRWAASARRATLLSTQLELGKRATLAAIRRDADARRIAAALRRLAAARSELAQAQSASAAPSFAPGASTLLAAPSYSSGYVFPVGGGAGVVSASHTHHDYPAVDIDAPLGSPLYALADGLVLRAWTYPDPRCGIGFTMQAFDGQVWTYCHLAVLDANVTAGARLQAGDAVGLVGATGDATGPHLHLQLQPADRWPQQEAWFQSFAGSAFSWSDPAPADATRTPAVVAAAPEQAPVQAPAQGRVFAVVPSGHPSNGVVLFTR